MNLHISKMLSLSVSSNSQRCAKIYLKNTNRVKNIMFAYATQTHPLDQTHKLADKLSRCNSIKVWSLEDLLSKSIDHHLLNQKKNKGVLSLNEEINAFSNFINKSQFSNEESPNVVVNRYFSTIQNLPFIGNPKQKLKSLGQQELKVKGMYKNLIEILDLSKNWGFIANFQNIINRHQSQNFNGLRLLIGDYNDALVGKYPQNSYITLEQLCAMYPQKVPLSYRKREPIQSIRTSIEKRVNQRRQEPISLRQEPRFSQIVVINDKIKMWDQAYQVMLDQLPIKIIVPFHLVEPSLKYYRLNLDNFIQGFKTSHRIIHPNIPLQIQQQNLQQFLSQSFKQLSILSDKKQSSVEVQVVDKELYKGNDSIIHIVC